MTFWISICPSIHRFIFTNKRDMYMTIYTSYNNRCNFITKTRVFKTFLCSKFQIFDSLPSIFFFLCNQSPSYFAHTNTNFLYPSPFEYQETPDFKRTRLKCEKFERLNKAVCTCADGWNSDLNPSIVALYVKAIRHISWTTQNFRTTFVTFLKPPIYVSKVF